MEQEPVQSRDYGQERIAHLQIAERMARAKTIVSSAHCRAVVSGARIGLIPNHARAIGGNVVSVGEIRHATHPRITNSKRHRQFIDFLADSFDEDRYPWFGEDFMTPAQIEARTGRDDLSAHFEGLTARR